MDKRICVLVAAVFCFVGGCAEETPDTSMANMAVDGTMGPSAVGPAATPPAPSQPPAAQPSNPPVAVNMPAAPVAPMPADGDMPAAPNAAGGPGGVPTPQAGVGGDMAPPVLTPGGPTPDPDVTPVEPTPDDPSGVDPGEGSTPDPTAWSPCPADGEPCKILPLGDSITFGIGFSGGYRVELFRKALEDGKSITFVGRQSNGPREVDGTPFPGSHEGYSGWTIRQIDGIVPKALSDTPQIILLMIGTNDMYMSPAGAPDRLDTLVGKLVAEAPDALLVVAQLTPLSFSNSAVETYNAALPAIVDAHAEAGEHVVLVDMFTGFSTGMLGDGVHPNTEGYAHMAGVWYDEIKDLLP